MKGPLLFPLLHLCAALAEKSAPQSLSARRLLSLPQRLAERRWAILA
jgi:hypothetical protein